MYQTVFRMHAPLLSLAAIWNCAAAAARETVVEGEAGEVDRAVHGRGA